jgi:hypothetical protein
MNEIEKGVIGGLVPLMEWNIEMINILNKIRLNSITLSNKHRMIALQYQSMSKYFDIPIIVLSTVSSSLGSLEYMPTDDKGSITLFISMFITILTSVKLYLNITSNLNNEISLSRDFYILSVDIYKNLNLQEKDRPNGKQFLNDCYNQYIKLTEQSNLFNKIKKDELLAIKGTESPYDPLDLKSLTSSSSSSDLSSYNDSPKELKIKSKLYQKRFEINTENSEV